MPTVIDTNTEFRNRANSEWSLLAQMTASSDLTDNRIDQLYWTPGQASSFYDQVADEELVSWLSANGTFKPYKGEPAYRTLERFWSHVASSQFSVHYKMSDREKKTLLGSQGWDQLAGLAGRGDAQAQRRTLIRLLATAESLECFDSQNLADTDHPGLRYDSATDTEITLTQSNLFLASTWNPATIETIVKAMTSYHDTGGNHYGNRFDERDSDLPSTHDLRTQAPKPSQFHVYAGSSAIDNIVAEARTWDNTSSKYAGSYSFDKLEELPANRFVVQWLNKKPMLPGVPTMADAPFIRKWDGTQVFVTADGESLVNRQHRLNFVDAHADHGFAPHWWARFAVGEEP